MKIAYRLLGIGLCALGVAAALVPWTLKGSQRRAEIEASMAQATGLDVKLAGPITIKLLPMPRIRVGGLSIGGSDGALRVDAPVLYGDLELSALAKGRWRLASATLSEPVITADLDRVPTAAALGAVEKKGFKLSVRSGVLRLRSQRALADTLATDVDVTLQQGESAEGSLALSGSAVWHGNAAQFAARITNPRSVIDGGSSPAFAHISSPLGVFAAAGDVAGGAEKQFVGRLSVSSNSVPRLFAAFGVDTPWLAIGRGTLSGDAIVRYGDLSLSSSELHLDDMAFEGTLGFHSDGARNLFEGTLATGLIDFGKLGGHKLDAATLSALFRAPWGSEAVPANIDLRVSANTARFGSVDINDAALSALFHDNRLELTLDEASAFEGIVKARAVAVVSKQSLQGHADISVSNVMVGPLSEALLGRERVSGELTGKLVVDGQGRSLYDVVHGLGGAGQLTLEHGSFTGVSVSQALKRLTRKLPPTDDQSGQITSFEKASAALRVEGGVMSLVDGQVTAPGISLSFGGRTELPGGRVAITAVAAQTDAAGSLLVNGPRLPFEILGAWDQPFRLVEHTRGVPLPFLPLRSLSPGQDLQ